MYFNNKSLVIGIGPANEYSLVGTLLSVIPIGAVFPDGIIDTSVAPRKGESYRVELANGISTASTLKNVTYPTLKPYSGEVIQIEHRKPLNRIERQMESYSFLFVF